MLITLDHLRRYAVARSLFKPTTLKAAFDRMAFVQADPIRAPARAQDLILRHRAKDYRAGDLERLYSKLKIEEDFFIVYGFMTKSIEALMHPRSDAGVPAEGPREWPAARKKRAQLVLRFVRERGEAHPREVDSFFSHGKVRNYWGGLSSATTHLLAAMPHLTEEMWSLLGLGKDSIQFAAPPEKLSLHAVPDVEERRRLVSSIYETVQAGRNLRSASKLPSNKKIRFILRAHDKTISGQIPTLNRLLNAEEVALDSQYEAPAGTPVAVTPLGELFLAIAAGDQARERERLDTEIARISEEARSVETKLQNNSFVERAPAAVVEEHRRRLNDFNAQLTKLKDARESLS